MKKFIHGLTKSRAILAIIAVVILSSFSAYLAKDLKFDYDFEKFFPRGDKALDFFTQHRAEFGADNDFLLIAAESEKGIFNASYLTALSTLKKDLEGIAGVQLVYSICELPKMYKTPFGLIRTTYLSCETPSKYKEDSLKLLEAPAWVREFVSQNGKAALIYLETDSDISKKESDALIFEIMDCFERFPEMQIHITGKAHGQHHYIKQMQEEMVIFTTVSVFILCFVLWVAFRSLWGVLVPISIVGCSILLLLGLISMSGRSLSMLTIILPSIIFVVGTSDAIHLVEKYFELLELGMAKTKALFQAIKEIGVATLLTSVTTAVGFLTLLTSSTSPIREFGVYAALGVMLAFFTTYAMLPPVLFLTRVPKRKKAQNRIWDGILGYLFKKTMRRPIPIAGIGLIFILLSSVGIGEIRINNHLLEDLSEENIARQEFRYFEENFGGVRPFELALRAGEGKSIMDPDVLSQIDHLESFSTDLYALSAVQSPLTHYQEMYRIVNARTLKDPAELSASDVARISKLEMSQPDLFSGRRLLDATKTKGRLRARHEDLGSYRMGILNEQFELFLAKEIDPDILQVRITGMSNLIDRNNEVLVGNLLSGLLIAFLVVVLIISLQFRSWNMIWIALIPNLMPLLFIGGVIGLFGIDLNVSKSIFFTIAFGIAVDDTIHFLSRYRQEIKKGYNKFSALKNTYTSTGKAIILTSFLLASGFSSLMFSDFASVYYLGLFVGIALVVAVLADLLILPLLIIYFMPPKKNAKKEG